MAALVNDLSWGIEGLRPPRLILGGDSTGQRNHSALSPTFATLAAGEFAQAQALGGAMFEMETWLDLADLVNQNGCNRCRSGTDIDQMLVSEMLTLWGTGFVMIAGINDIAHGYTGAQTFAHWQTTALQLAATGKPVFICNIRGNSNTIYHAAILVANALLKAWTDTNPAGIYLIDLYTVYATSPTDPTPKAGFLPDGTHQEGKGASAAAPVINAVLRRAFQPTIDARPRGTNLVSRPLFTGTGGTPAAGTSGQMSTDWYCQRFGSANTIVCAKDGADAQKVTVTGGAGAVADGFFIGRDFGSPSISLVNGDWYQWSLVAVFDAWAGWTSIRTATTLGDALYNTGSANDQMPAGAKTLTIVSPPVQAVSTVGSSFFIFVYCNGATAGSGAVTFTEARLMQVADPRPLHNR